MLMKFGLFVNSIFFWNEVFVKFFKYFFEFFFIFFISKLEGFKNVFSFFIYCVDEGVDLDFWVVFV